MSGRVFDPAGKTPLYNVVVYVPNAEVGPLTTGASCDRCGVLSGDPLVTTITDANGDFKLDNVPVGADIPVVVQVGKWRRQFVLPNVAQCENTKLDAGITRLPKNKAEGDIPQIAITTGGADVMECFLRKVGLEDSEFTDKDGNGRVHFYGGSSTGNESIATTKFDAGHGGKTFSSAASFWNSTAKLMKYDMVLLSCEGGPHSETKPDLALKALYDYANGGGRVFASHWHRYWFSTSDSSSKTNASKFESIGAWNDREDPPDPVGPPRGILGKVDASFPKGKAMSDWLRNVGASPEQEGQLRIREARHNLDSVNDKGQQWITLANSNDNNRTAVEYVSFNTPVNAADDQKCGRVVYSDLHVSSGDTHGVEWPTGCTTPELSAQEKALEFMLFDLSSCIQSDKEPPKPPPVR